MIWFTMATDSRNEQPPRGVKKTLPVLQKKSKETDEHQNKENKRKQKGFKIILNNHRLRGLRFIE